MSKYVPKAEETKMDPWQSLANAIVISAAKDYRTALRRLRRNPKNKTALSEIADLERPGTWSVHAQSRYQCLLSHVITDGTVT